MAQQLIRYVPTELKAIIRAEAETRGMSQQELALEVLRRGASSLVREQLPLYGAPPRNTETAAAFHLPFVYVDLFAGIGGMHQGLERLNGTCALSVEWDKHCQKVYGEWYHQRPLGNIVEIAPDAVPDHDILAAGFPCQPFSIAGVSKKNSLGRAHGFDDAKQGNLFFVLASIIEAKRPPAILLENVKNLKSHDGGNTWRVIENRLRSLRYDVHAKIIDASGWVPQHRERIYIVGFDQDVFGPKVDFSFPRPPANRPSLRDIVDPAPPAKYTLSDHLWAYLQNYAAKHKAAGNGFGFGLADLDGVTRTLSARYYKDGSEILVPQRGKNPRRLTPRECQRLMGFDDSKPISVSDTQAYKQFGNAVVPSVVQAVATGILSVFSAQLTHPETGCLLKRSHNGVNRMRKSG